MDTDTQYQYTDPENNSGKKKTLIIIAVIIILGGIIAAILALSGSFGQSSNPDEEAERVVDTCVEEACFVERYSSCQAATYEAIEETGLINYEISEPTETGCLISFEYLGNNNAELIGKSMSCNFENEVDFRSATTLVLSYPQDYGCEGELIEYL